MSSIVVVDPYSAGKGIAPAFAARGVDAIAVLTTEKPPAGLDWIPDDFAEVHVLHDLDELAAKLAVHEPIAVVPGTETGVETAETLSELIAPGRSNVLTLSSARRDKWQMAVALRTAEVPHLRQISSDRVDEVAAWLRREGLENSPIVLKPQESGGTDDVFVAMPGDDWQAKFNRILGCVNKLNIRNDKVLVQELAVGTEYEVDTYSIDGEHGLVAVWRYAKQRRGDRLGIYLSNTLVAQDEPVVDVLFDYVRQVLEATGVRNGPAHVEVMITPDGPRLIEIGARLAGAEQQELTVLGTGESQITRMVRHRVDGDSSVGRYSRRRHVKSVYLSSPAAGELGNSVRFDELASLLPSYQSDALPYREGSTVPRTDDLWTSLGSVVLASTDADQLERDVAVVREIEAGLIVV
ncbi:ATP-grasp domain-containing protein [Lentzea sp. BCCO 10_0061]|uniref:ATP-grasp domain-containing protein n=1 Tax=Lentzea sokolovensis TaxID=3095429 RepID=A0ABU4VD67_9PSEU|nr:ATP-grasp domain-containing protein [Lentzea sp. BCCO 10_0061]MDX8149385.1 ATP-grasp domain-containing protein [Lentzea sp. BCCO 10_0061]